jgi:phage baseplate assembly protein W
MTMSNVTNNPAAQGFGQCWSTPTGQVLSSPSTMASGFQAVAESIARIWQTTPGQCPDDPAAGENVIDLVNSDLSPRDVAQKQQRLARAAMRDERVLRIVVTLSFGNGTLSVTGQVLTAAGPFKLVLQVSQVTPTVLLVTQ